MHTGLYLIRIVLVSAVYKASRLQRGCEYARPAATDLSSRRVCLFPIGGTRSIRVTRLQWLSCNSHLSPSSRIDSHHYRSNAHMKVRVP